MSTQNKLRHKNAYPKNRGSLILESRENKNRNNSFTIRFINEKKTVLRYTQAMSFTLEQTFFFLTYFALFFLVLLIGEIPLGICLMGFITILLLIFGRKINFQNARLYKNILDQKLLPSKVVVVGFVSVGVGLAILTLLFFFFPQLSMYLNSLNLLVSTYGHNHAAAYFIFILPLVFFLWQDRWKTVQSKYILLPLLLIILALCLSFARLDMLIGLIEIFFCVGVSWVGSSKGQKRVMAFLLLPIFVVCLILGSLSVLNSYGVSCPLPAYQNKLCKPITKEDRPFYWQTAWAAFTRKPLLGWGGETFGIAANQVTQSSDVISVYAHNDYLDILVMYGIVGGGVFLVSVGLIFSQALQNIYRTVAEVKLKSSSSERSLNLQFFLSLSCLALGFDALFDFNWHYLGIWTTFMVAAALLLKNSIAAYSFLKQKQSQLKLVFLSECVRILFWLSGGILAIWLILYVVSSGLWWQENFNPAVRIFPFVYWRVEEVIGTSKIDPTTTIWLTKLYWSNAEVLQSALAHEENIQQKIKLTQRLIELSPQNFTERFQLLYVLLDQHVWFLALIQAQQINAFYSDSGGKKDLLPYAQQLDFAKQLTIAANRVFITDPQLASDLYYQAYIMNPWVIDAEPFQLLFQPSTSPQVSQNFLSRLPAQTPLWKYQDGLVNWYLGQIEETLPRHQFILTEQAAVRIMKIESWQRWQVWRTVSPIYQNLFSESVQQRNWFAAQQTLNSWQTVLQTLEGQAENEKVDYKYKKEMSDDFVELARHEVQ